MNEETKPAYFLSPSQILIQSVRDTAVDATSNENDGLVGIAAPTWGNQRKSVDSYNSYSTGSSGTYSTRTTANHLKSNPNSMLDIAQPDEYMDLSNPDDDLLNISLDLLEDFDDRRDDSSITLISDNETLSTPPNHSPALHTVFSVEGSDARNASHSTTHSTSKSVSNKNISETNQQSERYIINVAHEQASPHAGSSGTSQVSTPPKDSFGLPLLPFSHELFKKLRARRKIVDRQLKDLDKSAEEEPTIHDSTALELIIHEEKKEEELAIEVDHLTHLWYDKLMIELKSGNSESMLQFPGRRAKGRTTDKDSSNQPLLPSRRDNETKHDGLHSCSWIVLHPSSKRLMMMRSRTVPIVSFFGTLTKRGGILDRDSMFGHFVHNHASPEEQYDVQSFKRTQVSPRDLMENRCNEVRARALFRLEESKRRLKEYKQECA
jgi:hypothetical protein